MMVNVTSPLGWTVRCPDIWSSIILGLLSRVFLDEVDTAI